jgi:hypothetical protein
LPFSRIRQLTKTISARTPQVQRSHHEKNEVKPWRKQRWCIPRKQNAALVCQMEQVLEVYKRPYNPLRPVVCMDEQLKQLLAELRQPMAVIPGHPAWIGYEYVREGVCTAWMFVDWILALAGEGPASAG